MGKESGIGIDEGLATMGRAEPALFFPPPNFARESQIASLLAKYVSPPFEDGPCLGNGTSLTTDADSRLKQPTQLRLCLATQLMFSFFFLNLLYAILFNDLRTNDSH